VRALSNIKPFYIRALALVYRSNEGDDIQIGFVIDGKPSQEHELAFARSDEFQKLAKSLSIDPAEKQALETAVPEAIGLEPRSEVANELRLSTDKAEAQVLK